MTIRQWALCTAFVACAGSGCGNVKSLAADAASDRDAGTADTAVDAARDPDAAAACGVLPPAAQLGVNGVVNSCDRRFHLDMQTDGNLVLYQANGPLWGSGTSGKGGIVARMQTDGNLVVDTSSNASIWTSNTSGNPGAYAKVQDDGNFGVYSPGGGALWATGTTTRCDCYAADGDYCGFKVIEHATSVHCVLPFGFTSTNLYSCTGGSWRQKQVCTKGCTYNPGNPDTCTP